MNHIYCNRLNRRRIAANSRIEPSSAKPSLDFATVKAAARGRWRSLLERLGVAREALRDHHGPCPGCGGVDRFRFDDGDGDGTFICSNGGGNPVAGDGFRLLEHVHGWTPQQALKAVAETLDLAFDHEHASQPSPQPSLKPAAKVLDPEELQRRRTKLNAVWRASYQLLHPIAAPARRYLAERGLADLREDWPHDVRLHPRLTYWQSTGENSFVAIGDFPALVALVRNPQGQPVSLHRTWLTLDGDGKATVSAPKKLMTGVASLTGAAIRLYPAERCLAIAEGIETALSIRVALPGWPVWSTINSNGMKNLILPTSAIDVLICADRDEAGIKAAYTLADRLANSDITVRVIAPEQGDFNDLLKGA